MKRLILIICLLVLLGLLGQWAREWAKDPPRERISAQEWDRRAQEQEEREQARQEQERVRRAIDDAQAQARAQARQTRERMQQITNDAQIKVLEEYINGGLKNGAFYKIYVATGEVWMEPVVWSLLNVDQKQQMIRIFETYFGLYGSPKHATVRDKWNDEKLGGTGAFGTKIYK